jgi:tyrosyl-tRNA synthetase
MKSNWELLQHRTNYYKFIIREMLTSIGVPLEKLHFVQGTDYQLGKDYTLDVYKMSAVVTSEHTTKAGAEVVKQVKNPLMSNLLYPILQALDEQHLDVDCQFGGVDQRKIFMFAREHLPRIGYKKRIHLMNPLVPGLGKSGKMSSSEPLSKVDFDDSDEGIRNKFGQAYSVDGQVAGNGLLAMLKHVVFKRLEAQSRPFVVRREAQWGGDISFNNYAELEKAFAERTLASKDLKGALAEEIILLVRPLREAMSKNQTLVSLAYPVEVQEPVEAKQTAPTTQATIASLDVRVGKILKVEQLAGSDSLYKEEIDVGEAQPRTILSGLVKYVPIDQMQDRLVLVVCNLPPKTMLRVTSQGMVLAASQKTGKETTAVALVDPPAGSKPGDKLVWPEDLGVADAQLTPKRLERVLPKLKTTTEGIAVYVKSPTENLNFTVAGGVCTSSLKDAVVG